MAPRFTYMSYPVDQVGSRAGEVRELYERLEDAKIQLLEQGVDIVFDPGDAFRILKTAEVGAEVREINQLALDYADSVLAMLPALIPSIGVPMEIDAAAKDGKVVAVLTDVKAWMLGFDDTMNVMTFPLEPAGFAQAAIWLAAHPRRVLGDPPKEKMPFTILVQADCGKQTVHAAHAFGEDFEDDCSGFVDLTPTKTYEDDAGFDLVVAEDYWIAPYGDADIRCGIAVQLPPWAFGRITGRSSTLRKLGLLVNEGIIDAGFRGELFAYVRNLMDREVVVQRGDRIAQFILHSNVSTRVELSKVRDLVMSPRGDRGFGSSGT